MSKDILKTSLEINMEQYLKLREDTRNSAFVESIQVLEKEAAHYRKLSDVADNEQMKIFWDGVSKIMTLTAHRIKLKIKSES